MSPSPALGPRLAPLALLVGTASCGFLSTPPTRFELSAEWSEPGAAEPHAAADAHTALDALFGTPVAPRLPLLDDWRAQGFDPNRPAIATGHGGSGELGAVERERIRAGNRARFARDLERLDEGRFDDVGPWPESPALSAAWEALRDERAGAATTDELAADARALLVDHYPSLRDSAALYARRCATCHGVEGGGDGPGSRFLSPRPRDFRHGVFKFSAAEDGARPRRADLVRVLEEGIEGTAMPSFSRYGAAELHGLADYVRLLAVRGETEGWLLDDAARGRPIDEARALEAFAEVFEEWRRADERTVPVGTPPPSTPELVALGRRLFLDEAKGNCASCHGPEGRGDGPAVTRPAAAGISLAFRDAWGDEIRPRDLTRGGLRYGSAPEDLYRRIWAGIDGTPMPGIGDVRRADGGPLLSERELWAIVHYVRDLAGLTAGEEP